MKTKKITEDLPGHADEVYSLRFMKSFLYWQFRKLKLMFKTVSGQAPDFLKGLFKPF